MGQQNHEPPGRALRPARVCRALSGALALAALLVSLPGYTDDAEATAARLFQQGSSAYAAGEFTRAAELFESAHRAAPRAATICSAALAREAAGDKARAADEYETALQLGGLEDKQDADARARLAALNKVVGTLNVTGPIGGTVTAAHVERAPIPSRLHVEAGTVDVLIERRDGSRETRRVAVPPGQTATLRIDDVAAAPPPAPVKPPAPSPPRGERTESGGVGRTLGWVALGAGVAAGGVAAGLGVATLHARDDYKATGYRSADAQDKTLALRTWTNVALAGAVVLAATGIVLLLVTPSHPKRPDGIARIVLGSPGWGFGVR